MNNDLINVENNIEKEPVIKKEKKKIDKKLILIPIILIIGIIVFVIVTSIKPKSNIIVENEHLSITVGTIYPFNALSYPSKEEIIIESLNEDIISVEKYTDIRGLKEGTATLLLKNTKEERKVIVEVTKEEILLEKLNIKEEVIKLKYNEEYLIEIETTPLNATIKDIEWTSSNEDIIIVNNGYIKAVGVGQAKIEANINGYKDIITIIVGKENKIVKVEEISFDNEVITVGLNNTYQLNPIIYPGNASNKKIEYIVEEEGIIEISNLGLVKGIKKGITKVTALSPFGVTKEIEIKVEETDETIALNVEDIQIARNETYQLKSDYVSGIEWYSSNEKVVTVDNGKIKGINDGKAVVTVINSYGKMNSVNVTVKGKGTEAVKINVNESEISLQVGKSYQIEAEVYPSNATNKDIYWETSDSRIATVTDTGLIFGKYEGKATITGYTLNNKRVSIRVNVSSLAVSIDSLDISPSSISIKKGDTYQLLATTVPSNATNNSMIWTSSNESVVTVENGQVKGNKIGSATIYAQIDGIKAKAQVNVVENIIEISSINLKEETLEMNIGESQTLSLDYLPTNATNKAFKWESNNTNVISVINGRITAVGSGEAIVTASSDSKSDSVKVVVRKSEGWEGILAVKLNYESLVLSLGQTKQLKATIIPLNKNQEVEWINGDANIARVDNNGIVTAYNPGKTTIAAIAKNGMIAKVDIYVTYPQVKEVAGDVLANLESDSLKVIVTVDEGHKVSRIWAADPYNQFHKIDSVVDPKTNNRTETVGDLLNRAVKENNLYNSIVIGGNASPYHGLQAQGPIIITEGKTIRFYPGDRRGLEMEDHGETYYSPTQYFGINSSGELKGYGPALPIFDKAMETQLYNDILNDGVKNTIAVWIGNVLVNDGKVVTSVDDGYTLRQTFCQVDRNNFVLISSAGGTSYIKAADMLVKYGCRYGFNMDGGGSTSSYYKNKGDKSVTTIFTRGRLLGEAIYFSEI